MTRVCLALQVSVKKVITTAPPLFWKLAFLLFLSLPKRISSGVEVEHKVVSFA